MTDRTTINTAVTPSLPPGTPPDTCSFITDPPRKKSRLSNATRKTRTATTASKTKPNTTKSKATAASCCWSCQWRDVNLTPSSSSFRRSSGKKNYERKIMPLLFACLLPVLVAANFWTEHAVASNSDDADSNSAMSCYADGLAKTKMCLLCFTGIGVFLLLIMNVVTVILDMKWWPLPDKKRASASRKKEMEEMICGLGIKEDIRKKKLEYAEILSKSIKIATVSYDKNDSSDKDTSSNKTDPDTFLELHDLLRESFPLLHRLHPPKIINEHSLLYKIPSNNTSNDDSVVLKPLLFCAHLDVVPADQQDGWDCDPFSGLIRDGVIWGRGAIDNKHNLITQLASMEYLLSHPSIPRKRTIYIACGHDEEIGGEEGAAQIAQYFSHEKLSFEAIFDEGTMMISGAFPGLRGHTALVGTSEKGNVTVQLTIEGDGGHSSIPPIDQDNIIKVMARAVQNIETYSMKPHLEPHSTMAQFLCQASHFSTCSYALKLVARNLWLLRGLVSRVAIRANKGVAASLRTTTATTIISGGNKVNVLPSFVRTLVNHRVHPLDTIQSVLDHDRNVINDKRINVQLLPSQTPPSPITDHNAPPYQWISDTVSLTYQNYSSPFLMLGNTDTRWYWDFSPNIFRFSPVELTMEDTSMFHGVNERIGVDALADMVVYYITLIIRSGLSEG